MTEHLAILTWTEPEPQGFSRPHSLQCTALPRFPEEAQEEAEEPFQVLCRFTVPPSENRNPCEARVSFLDASAPHHRLQPGRRFDLYQQEARIASVEVLW